MDLTHSWWHRAAPAVFAKDSATRDGMAQHKQTLRPAATSPFLPATQEVELYFRFVAGLAFAP